MQVQAHLLQLLDRDEEAVDLLKKDDGFLQSGPIAAQLFTLLAENGRWQEAEAALERYVALSPLLESLMKKWVASQHARNAYHLGKRAEAAIFAGTLEDEFHKSFCRKLGFPRQPQERVQLDVTFVPQHFKTCAPETLAAVGRYWGLPAEHLKLAEAMCYDGTPHWQQRQWAENNGWLVREFRVTHESAVSLLTREIPFALSTVEATCAHMQAVVGFDQTRGTLLLRDPSQPYIIEAPASDFLKRYRPFGPHGMIFLPTGERARLEAVALPDVDIYDEHHQLWLALSKHDRQRAVEILSQMETRFPDHELNWEARLDLATYDANHTEQLRCLDKLRDLEQRFSAWRVLHVMKDVRRTFRRSGNVFIRDGGG